MRSFVFATIALTLASCSSVKVTKDYDPCDRSELSDELKNDCRMKLAGERNALGSRSELRSRSCDENLLLTGADKGLLREAGRKNCRYSHRVLMNLILQCKIEGPSENELKYLPGIPARFKDVKWRFLEREGVERTSHNGTLNLKLDLVTSSESAPKDLFSGGERLLLEIEGKEIAVTQMPVANQPIFLPRELCQKN